MALERILIVDDEREHLDTLAEIMSREFDVATALNGREGLRTMEAIDNLVLVLSDLDMPIMDGAEFLQYVRVINRELIRVLMSGRINDPGFDPNILLGADPHMVVSKPIAGIKLRNELKGLLKP